MIIEDMQEDIGAIIISKFKGYYDRTSKVTKPRKCYLELELLSNGNFTQIHKKRDEVWLEKHRREELDDLIRIYRNPESDPDYAQLFHECYFKAKKEYEKYDEKLSSCLSPKAVLVCRVQQLLEKNNYRFLDIGDNWVEKDSYITIKYHYKENPMANIFDFKYELPLKDHFNITPEHMDKLCSELAKQLESNKIKEFTS